MNGLPEFLLTPFGQGRKQQGRQDYDENFIDQYRAGEIERDSVETFFDNLLRGGSEKVQAAAQQRHIDRLESTAAGQYLMDERDRAIKATDTDKGIRKASKEGRKEDTQIDRLLEAGYTGNVDDLKGKGAGAIAAMIPGQQRLTRSTNFAEDPTTKLLLANQKEARLDRLADRADARAAQNRQYELQIMQLQDFIDKNNELGRKEQEEYNQRSTESPTETVSENDASTPSLSESYPTPSSKETLSGSFPKPISSGQAMSAGLGSYKGGPKATQSQMTKFAEQAGFSPENAKIMAAIAMGESGGRLKIDTVQSGLDPNMTNEFSVGATQINVQAHGDKLAKLGYTSDDLRDPVKNFQVAKMVYDEMGSFSPWSVYKSGDYKQYLD